MFDIGFWELATIAIIGIVVVGPERLPEVVRTIAAYVRRARRAFQDVKSDIERELDLDELRRQMHEVDMDDHIKKLNQSVLDAERDARRTVSRFDHQLREELALNDPEVRAVDENDPPDSAVPDTSARPDVALNADAEQFADTGVEREHTPTGDRASDEVTPRPSSKHD